MRFFVLFVAAFALLIATPSRADFWEDYDQKFKKHIDEETELYLQHKQEKELLGDLADTKIDHRNRVRNFNLAAEPTPVSKPLFGLEAVGHGLNWWDGSFTAQPLIEWGSNLKNTYLLSASNEIFSIPDEVLIVNTPMVSRDGEVSYQENYNEFASMRANKFGLGIGYGSFVALGGSVENGRVMSVFRKETIRTAQVDTRAVYYSMNLLPPSFLKLRKDIADAFFALPRFDAGTRLIWFDALRRLGSHIVIGAELGGTAHMDSVVDTVEFGTRGSSWTKTQLSIQFMSFTSPDLGSRQEKAAALDETFKKATQSNFKYQGGNAALQSYDQAAWLASLPSNLVPLRYRTLPLHEFFPPGTRLYQDLSVAINEFLVFSAPQPVASLNLGPLVEVGQQQHGASISVTSYRTESRQVCHSCWIFFRCCRTVTDVYDNYWDLIREGGSAFIFGRDDGNQRATVTLGSYQYVKKIYAYVSPPGAGRPTTQMTMIGEGSQWDAWGAGNKPVTSEMSVTSDWPVPMRTIQYNFGPAPPGTGSMAYKLRVYAIQQSAPAGGVEGVNRFNIDGWAFDPIDPIRATDITIYVDGQVHATGKTSSDRPEIRSRYKLPGNARPGFSISLNIPKNAMRKHEIYVVWRGVSQQGRSNTMYLWSIQPPGRLLFAEPSRVQGWAYIHDQPTSSYNLEIWVDGKKSATGFTGTMDSDIVRNVFGANGKYGFEIPLAIKTAGVHQITAVMIAPDGTRLQFEDTLTVDLRFPLGEIFDVAPGWVAGFAYDPSKPNEPTAVHVYVDGALQAKGTTKITLPEYNARYLIEGTHGFNITLRMQGGKLHMVSVYAAVGVSLKLIGEKSVAVGLNDKGTSKVTNGVINFAGVGFNPCYGEFRLRVVDMNYKDKKTVRDAAFKDTNLYNLEIPDEYDLYRSSEQLFQNNTEVYRNIKEWSKMQMHSWKVGFSLGFFGFSSSYQKVTLEKHFTDDMARVADAKRVITLFEMKAAPAELLPFTSYANYELFRLPAYNVVTRPQWFRFFDLFGLTYAKNLKLGGRMDFQALYRTTNSSYARYEYERQQSGFAFTFYITLSASWEHAQSEAAVDKSFLNSLNQNVRFIGGHPDKFNVDQSEEWMRTIRENPAIIDMELESISELLWKPDQAQRKAWFDAAAADYMRTCTPESWVCRRYNVANVADGAHIIGASSRQTGEPDSSLANLLAEPLARVAWNGETSFQFADDDRAQYIVMDLGNVLNVKAIAIDLDPYPSQAGVWDFVRVETSRDQTRWAIWGSVGDANGQVDVTKSHYDFPLLVEEPVRFVRFSFGAVRAEVKQGAKIHRLYVYTCA